MRALLRYIADLSKGWVGMISSAASVILLIIGFIWKLTERGKARYWLIAASAAYALASFVAWYRLRPRLNLYIDGLSLDSGMSDAERIAGGSYITVRFYAVNTAVPATSIRQYALEIKPSVSRRIDGAPVRFPDGLRLADDHELLFDRNLCKLTPQLQGWAFDGAVRFHTTGSIPELKNRTLRFIVVDAYGIQHKAKCRVPVDETLDLTTRLLNP